MRPVFRKENPNQVYTDLESQYLPLDKGKMLSINNLNHRYTGN